MKTEKFKVTPLERAWILYDVGNSAFVLMIATLVPIFFNALAEAGGVSKVDYLAYWGYASSIVTVVTAILGPILGTLADTKGFKKPIFMLCLFVGVIGCCAMGLAGTWLAFLVIFIIAKIGYSGSLVFYDSMLGDVTTPERMDMVSSRGYAWGYIGSCVPFVVCLALVLGAGFAERVGLLPSLMVKMSSHVSARYASYMVLFIAFFSHISSDAALVIMPPLGALMFLAVGRHPVAGLLAAIAGVGCGFTANLLIVTTDVLLSGISTEAAKTLDASLHVSVIDNWYFMATSVIVLTLVGGLITDKLVEPRLGQWQGGSDETLQTLTAEQRFGLRVAGVAALLFVAVIALMVIPENGILRDPIKHTVMPSPFIKGIVPLIIFFFFVVSLAYGIATGKIRRQADLPQLMIEPMKEMAGFIVMVFPLAQFVAMFNRRHKLPTK